MSLSRSISSLCRTVCCLLAATLAVSCSTGEPTQLIVVIDSDLKVGDELDRIRIVVNGLAEKSREASLELDASQGTDALPKRLSILRENDSVEFIRLIVAGDKRGETVVERTVVLPFVDKEVMVAELRLLAACRDVQCEGEGETCGEGGCRSDVLPVADLVPFDSYEEQKKQPDVGPKCVATDEICNGIDDNCDAVVDEGFVFASDSEHCGGCGKACEAGGVCENGQCRNPKEALHVVSGDLHACVRNVAGEVLCWGDNNSCQLTSAVTSRQAQAPRIAAGIDSVAALSSGGRHSCAQKKDGTVWCWGSNIDGQLGQPVAASVCEPTRVGTYEAAVVSAGQKHSCIVTANAGEVVCWGSNENQQLGRAGLEITPAVVEGLPGPIVDVSAGHGHTCAVTLDGRVFCWGDNRHKQLGADTPPVDGEFPPSYGTPLEVKGLAPVKSVTAGGRHTCALLRDESVVCWGANDVRQLASTIAGPSVMPLAVPELAEVVALNSAFEHTCAATRSGIAYCWGNRSGGRLGASGSNDRVAPLVVPIPGDSIAVSASATQGYTVITDGTVWSWGSNGNRGKLGRGGNAKTPAKVDAIP